MPGMHELIFNISEKILVNSWQNEKKLFSLESFISEISV